MLWCKYYSELWLSRFYSVTDMLFAFPFNRQSMFFINVCLYMLISAFRHVSVYYIISGCKCMSVVADDVSAIGSLFRPRFL